MDPHLCEKFNPECPRCTTGAIEAELLLEEEWTPEKWDALPDPDDEARSETDSRGQPDWPSGG